jgi:hypothetical protein
LTNFVIHSQYAVFGNPVDAYKYFEYTHQPEFLPHRYLPDHIILCSVPKPEDYKEPKPSVIGASRRHAKVRMLMAWSNDQGVDVIDVLLKEYKLALLRKGHGRVEVDRLCAIASERLDEERRYPTGNVYPMQGLSWYTATDFSQVQI